MRIEAELFELLTKPPGIGGFVFFGIRFALLNVLSMDIKEEAIKKAWKRSEGKCECQGECGMHSGRCEKDLSYANRGRENGWGCWELVPTPSSLDQGQENVGDCLVLCWKCYCRVTLL